MRALGFVILALAFAAIFAITAWNTSWREATAVWGACIFIVLFTALVIFGFFLAVGA